MSHQEPDLHAIFNDAIERESEEERSRYLDEVCQNTPRIRERVEALLRAHADPRNVLGAPSPLAAATLDLPSIAERPGQTIGCYKLLEEIGDGGMGVVYMAEQREPVRRRVALKIIKPGMDTREVVARFEAERQALALMDHPNIAKALEAGVTGSGRPYFVMELVNGVPLTDYCDQNRLTTNERLQLFAQVCRAIEHAHQKGIIHRDIKPSNVMVTLYDGVPVPKIIDFGVAKSVAGQLTDKTLFTHHGQMLGTPLYMSPEQAERSGLDVDTRSDIYSLGVMLYEILTGGPPLDRERVREVAYDELRRMIREDDPPRPSARISTLGAAATVISGQRKTDPTRLSQLLRRDLDWIVMKALQKDRRDRYQTASDFARDIERYLHDEPVEARPPALADRAAKWARRHRPLVASAVVLLVLGSIGSLISTLLIAGAYEEKNHQLTATEKAEKLAREQEGLAKQQETLAKQQRQEAVRQREISDGNLYVAHMRQAERDWEQGQIGRLHEMLDSHFPQPGQPDLRGWEWYYYLGLCHGEARTLLRSSSHVSVAWSPDGKRLATSGRDEKIRVWNAAAGQEILTLSAATASWGVAWSPDGKRLASAQWDRTATVWDLAAGKAVFTFGGFSNQVVSVAWSPDGDRLAGGDWDGVIKVWDTVKGKEILNLRGARYPVAWSPDGKRLAISKAESGSHRGDVQIVDAVTGVELLSFSPKGGDLWDLAWSPDGKRLASSEIGNWVRVWDPATGRELLKLRQLGTGGTVAWSPDGKRLATASFAQRISVWDIATGREALTLRGHRSGVQSVSWSPDGNQLASAGEDGMVKVWDVRGKLESPAMEGARAVMLTWSPQGRRLAWTGGGKVTLWDAKRGEEVLMGDVDAQQVAWSPSGKHLAVGKPGGIVVLDVETRRETRTLPSGDVKAISWSPDTTRLAVASGPMIEVWDVANGRKVLSWPRLTAGQPSIYSVPSVAWSPDGSRVASAENGAVFVWDAATGKELVALRRSSGETYNHVDPVAWSPDGKHLAWSGDVAIDVWDASTGRTSRRLTGHTGTVRLVAWSPDSKRLVSASEDGTVRIWDPTTGQELLSLFGSFAAWSSDGRCLATIGDPDGTVRIWDASLGYAFASGIEYQTEINLAQLQASWGRARGYFQAGAWDEKIAACTEIIRLGPESAEAYNNRGALYGEKGEYDKAIADFTEAIRLDPKLAVAHLNRGLVYEHKGEHNKAIAHYTEVIRLDPKSAAAYTNRGGAYYENGEHDKAIADLTEAIRLDPKTAFIYKQRGVLYLKKGEYDKAIADCTEAIRLDPKYAIPYNVRGTAYDNKGESDKAIADCTEAIRLDPKYALPYHNRGAGYNRKGESDKAIADYTEAIRLDPKLANPHAHRGWAYAKKGEYDKAIADCREAVRLGQAGAETHLEEPPEIRSAVEARVAMVLAEVHWRLGDKDLARRWYDKAVVWMDKNKAEAEGLGRIRAEAAKLLGISEKP